MGEHWLLCALRQIGPERGFGNRRTAMEKSARRRKKDGVPLKANTGAEGREVERYICACMAYGQSPFMRKQHQSPLVAIHRSG